MGIFQYQYPAKAEPVFVPAVADEALTWMGSQPAGFFGGEQTQYQIKVEPVFVDEVAPETITLDKWFQPASIPARDVEFATQTAFEFAPTQEPEIVTLAKWFQPASQPTPDVEENTLSTGSFYVDLELTGPPEVITLDKWFQPASQPLQEVEFDTSSYPSRFSPDQEPELVTISKWFQPNSQPTPDFEYDTLSTGSFYTERDFTAPPEVITLDKWQQPFSQPVPDVAPDTLSTGEFKPTQEPEAITLDKWFQPAEVPQFEVPETLRVESYYAMEFTPPVIPAPSMDGWVQPTNQFLEQDDIPDPGMPFAFGELHTVTVAAVPADLSLTLVPAYCLSLSFSLDAYNVSLTFNPSYNLSLTVRNLMSGEIDIGDQVRIRGVFTDPNNGGAVIDPTTVTIRHKDPSGNIIERVHGVDAEVIKEGTGIYYEDVTIDEYGHWTCKILGTGAAVAAEESGFRVKEEKTPTP